MLRGLTSVKSVSELVGQNVDCELFVQTASNGPMMASPLGSTVSVRFSGFDNSAGTIEGMIQSGDMIDSTDKKVAFRGGSLVGTCATTWTIGYHWRIISDRLRVAHKSNSTTRKRMVHANHILQFACYSFPIITRELSCSQRG